MGDIRRLASARASGTAPLVRLSGVGEWRMRMELPEHALAALRSRKQRELDALRRGIFARPDPSERPNVVVPLSDRGLGGRMRRRCTKRLRRTAHIEKKLTEGTKLGTPAALRREWWKPVRACRCRVVRSRGAASSGPASLDAGRRRSTACLAGCSSIHCRSPHRFQAV